MFAKIRKSATENMNSKLTDHAKDQRRHHQNGT